MRDSRLAANPGRTRTTGHESLRSGASIDCASATALASLGTRATRAIRSCAVSAEPLSGRRELCRLTAPIEQVSTQPLLQGTYAAAERGLGHVPLLRRARKVPGGHERQESHRARKGSWIMGGSAFQASKSKKTALAPWATTDEDSEQRQQPTSRQPYGGLPLADQHKRSRSGDRHAIKTPLRRGRGRGDCSSAVVVGGRHS